jgi:membrane-associated phospholipid phosphatase
LVNKKGSCSLTVRQYLFVVILLFLGANIAYGSTDELVKPSDGVSQEKRIEPERSRTGEVKLNKEYFKGFITDTEDILTSPSRWDKSDWLTASLVTGIAAGLYVNDDKIKDWVQKNKNTTSADIVRNGRRVGAATLPALGAFYLYGYLTDNDKAQKTVLLSVESFAITGVFVQTLKFGTHRHRPYTGDAYNTWNGPSFDSEGGHLSFPSGDASSAFAVATVIASEYEDNVIVPLLAYGIATVFALGRLHDNGHWSSDVFVASAIGYFTGKAVVKSHDTDNKSNITLIPVTDGKNVDLLLTCQF